tara:strand:+ start:310 stop:894 length:585 start_codon:yes stop_codon:yes gene_type:complete
MPNPRMNAAKMKAEALKKAKANKMKSKIGSPTKKTGKAKPAAAVKNTKVYKKINSTSTYKPKFEKASDEELKMASPAKMSGRSYDMKMAYNKKLTPKARLHYLENERHDAPGKMKGSPYHMSYKDSPMNKALVGNQKNLPEHLKKKIEAAPQMKGSPYHMSDELKYGGPVIDQMQTLSQKSAMKVLKHSKGSKI